VRLAGRQGAGCEELSTACDRACGLRGMRALRSQLQAQGGTGWCATHISWQFGVTL
jgi:hypothetical protein